MIAQYIFLSVFIINLISIFVSGQQCNTRRLMNNYLNCLKNELDQNYESFEEEMQLHTKQSVETCFSQTTSDANLHERCVLAVTDLNSKAWDRNGPLRDCSICRTFALGAIKAVLSTPAEDQKCIREQITKAIKLEAEHCLRQKIPNFQGLSNIPDLEEGAYRISKNVIDSISDNIIINSRLSFCGERKPGRATATRQCLKVPFPGYFQKHCSALAQCDQSAENGCLPTLHNIKTATCACIDEARDDLKRRIGGIADVIRNAVLNNGRGAPLISGLDTKVDYCVGNIKRQLITPSNDWTNVIDSALNNCIKNKPSGQSLGIDSLLNVGCRKIISDTTETASAQIKTGFEFVNKLIDAMVERYQRFCGGAHC